MSDVSRKVVPDKRSLTRERPLTKALNPFTAAACKIYGPNSIFYGPITHLLSKLYVLMKTFSNPGAKKKRIRLNGFKFSTFIGRFQVT